MAHQVGINGSAERKINSDRSGAAGKGKLKGKPQPAQRLEKKLDVEWVY